jgi:hypothetical protein
VTTWTEWVTASLGAWVVKGAVALGFGVLTYAGWDGIKGQLDSAVSGALASVPGSLYGVLALAGFIDAIGIWLGAFTVVVTLLAFRRLAILNS